jgi:hypothetical protein
MKSLLILGDVGRGWTMRLCLAAAVALGLGVAGCSPSYVTDNTAPVNVYIAAINDGKVLTSDVRIGANSNLICPDFVNVAVAVRNKNPNSPIAVPSHVLFTNYEVRYFRTDGRGVEGVDVPYRITGSLATESDVATSGTTNIPLEVVRRQAKLEPPLSTITQTVTLTMMAQVTVFGQTIAGQNVSSTASFQIDFADFADSGTTCPTS